MSTIVQTYGDGTKEIYLKHEELGQGGFATVYRVTNQKTNRDYAIKVIPKERYEGPNGKKAFEKLKNEIKIQRILNHPNIVKSYGSFSDDFNYYIILEYCPNKSVKELLRNSPTGYLSESVTRRILLEVVEAIAYLHSKHVVHRDLKLENYMIGSDGNVKIADFGLSVILQDDDQLQYTFCGTPNYFSPELLQEGNKGYSYEVDIWAIGVSAFTMLTGHTPFEGERKSITYENIKNCDYHFPSYIPISPLAKNFIKTIFEIDPDIRPTAIDLLGHKFLTTTTDKEQVCLIKKNVTTYTSNQSENSSSARYYNFHANISGHIRPKFPLPTRDVKKYNNNNSNSNAFHSNVISSVTSEQLFNLPRSAVSRYLINGKDLGYLLANGIVGACFTDHSRMVMDPNEDFIQYYRNYGLNLKIIDLDDYDSKKSKKDKLYDKISLIKKFAKTLKKTTSLYDLPTIDFDTTSTLNYIKYYKIVDDTIIFRFNDKNVQVNFNDHKKLFIFWDTKQMCLVRNIKDKCALLNLNDVVNMNPKTDEYKKLIAAKNLMSQL